MSKSGETRKGKYRGKYQLHKTNKGWFKKGQFSWKKGTGEPLEGDKECPICHKIFHYKRAAYNPPPKTCSKECRYKSASITGTHHIKRNCIVCNNEFTFAPSVTKDRATIFCSLICRRASTINYPKIIKQKASNELWNAIGQGILTKQPCEVCEDKAVEGHHFMGYKEKYWLIVKWLCKKHHAQEHNRLRQTGESLLL